MDAVEKCHLRRCSLHANSGVQSEGTLKLLVELVDKFLTEKLCNNLFIYLWKCIVLAGKWNKITN